jgi:hypothetical protein
MIYFCWLTLMSLYYEDSIIANMVREGYKVRGGLVGGEFSAKGKSNIPMSILLVESIDGKKNKAALVLADLKKALDASKAKYYSVVITESGNSAYETSNIIIPEVLTPSKPITE